MQEMSDLSYQAYVPPAHLIERLPADPNSGQVMAPSRGESKGSVGSGLFRLEESAASGRRPRTSGAGGSFASGIRYAEKKNWKEHLSDSLQQLNVSLNTTMTDLHKTLLHKSAKVKCVYCRHSYPKLDILELAGETTHSVCQRCAVKLITNTTEYLYKHVPEELRRPWEWLATRMIVCPSCRQPSIIKQVQRFEEGFARQSLTIVPRTKYVVVVNATDVLKNKFKVLEHHQNQRRVLFGTFKATNLLSVDFRGALSTVNGTAYEGKDGKLPTEADLDEIEKFRLPNKRWFWLEPWTPDVTRETDTNGWQYAFNWPQSNIGGGSMSKDASLFSFVRRRCQKRTRICLNDEVLESFRELGFGVQ